MSVMMVTQRMMMDAAVSARYSRVFNVLVAHLIQKTSAKRYVGMDSILGLHTNVMMGISPTMTDAIIYVR